MNDERINGFEQCVVRFERSIRVRPFAAAIAVLIAAIVLVVFLNA